MLKKKFFSSVLPLLCVPILLYIYVYIHDGVKINILRLFIVLLWVNIGQFIVSVCVYIKMIRIFSNM